MVARHARSASDGDLLAEALGIDGPAEDWLLAGRISRLADSIGGPA
jgi:hypothetical protein